MPSPSHPSHPGQLSLLLTIPLTHIHTIYHLSPHPTPVPPSHWLPFPYASRFPSFLLERPLTFPFSLSETIAAVLAEGFQLTDGRVEITVPYVDPGCGYQLVLFGDSGNFSPEFMIAAEGD